jgi:hypothetical protein
MMGREETETAAREDSRTSVGDRADDNDGDAQRHEERRQPGRVTREEPVAPCESALNPKEPAKRPLDIDPKTVRI